MNIRFWKMFISAKGGRMNALFTRRSIRKYTSQPIDGEMIDYLLKAAMVAPSAGNQQPWQFVVMTSREVLDQVPHFHPHAKMVTGAPAAILVCGDLTLEKHKDYWVQDCSAAAENLLLAAEVKGLGAVWLGVYPREDRVKGFRTLLGVPDHSVPFACIVIGFPGEHKEPAERFNKDRIHYNKW
jgi:nitroreductase